MSRKTTASATNTTSQYYDQRSVVDAGGGIVGHGNRIDESVQLTNIDGRDLSNRSTTTLNDSRTIDESFRLSSTDSRDFSNRSTTTITDGGAFDVVRDVADGIGSIGRMQVDATRAIASAGGAASDNAFALAQRAQLDASSFNTAAASRVFDLASSSQARAFDSSGEALGFTRETFGDVLGLAGQVIGQAGSQAREAASVAGGAYQSAADTATGNKTLVYAALAAVALVAMPMFFKR